jgi:hypothetical protein
MSEVRVLRTVIQEQPLSRSPSSRRHTPKPDKGHGIGEEAAVASITKERTE